MFSKIFSATLIVVVTARPELPIARAYRQNAFLPAPPPLQQQLPRQTYGPPSIPQNNYGSPAASYGPPSLPPIVTKNVYVHLPPDEEEGYQSPQVLLASPPKKHYKLIFIKAPEPPRYVAPVIPQQPQDEHKTLVYVLVKKPDEQQQIELPSAQPTEPSKPEVYFIKYKAQQEAAQAPYPAAGQPIPPPSAQPSPAYGAPPQQPTVDFGPVTTF